jgi:hypothetical protein
MQKAQGVMRALDALGAAYTRKVGIDPTQACLMVEELPLDEQVKSGKRLKYWFTHHEPTPNLQEAHPDVKTVFQYAMDLSKAHELTDVPAIQALLDGLSTFMKSFEEPTDGSGSAEAVSVQGGAELQDAERETSGTP